MLPGCYLDGREAHFAALLFYSEFPFLGDSSARASCCNGDGGWGKDIYTAYI